MPGGLRPLLREPPCSLKWNSDTFGTQALVVTLFPRLPQHPRLHCGQGVSAGPREPPSTQGLKPLPQAPPTPPLSLWIS